MFVFDIGNTAYDAALGHFPEQQQNRLPVSIVRLSNKVRAYPANPPIQNRVNSDIAELHNCNGVESVPPFVVDYTQGPPVYLHLRDPSLLRR